MIFPNVVIGDRTVIGNNCIIQSGTVLGEMPLLQQNAEGYRKMLSVGNVIIENNVEIGNLCTIDRGVTDSTIIGAGSILDNQIQIGHTIPLLVKSSYCFSNRYCRVLYYRRRCYHLGTRIGIASGKRVGKGAVLLVKLG